MKPILLVTLYRRYHELDRNLAWFWEHANEFRERPEVVLVWAEPELDRLWFIEDLLSRGMIHHVVSRLRLPGEVAGQATSYPESHNLRKGLEFIRRHYHDQEVFVVGHAADVKVKKGLYAEIDSQFHEKGAHALVFHWQNGCCHEGIWHTNCFAVSTDRLYWPPLSTPDHQDVLERQWGKYLQEMNPPRVVTSANYNQKNFSHDHLSEDLPEFPRHPRWAGGSVALHLSGRRRWYLRALDWLRGVSRCRPERGDLDGQHRRPF
jgi:hypothetical protein